jgi:hypothetical protein
MLLINVSKKSSSGLAPKERTLALTFPCRTWQEKDEKTGEIKTHTESSLTVCYYEDLKAEFGGEIPAQVMKNIFNYAIEKKMAESAQ